MDKFEIRLKCLELAGGDICRAEEIYKWVTADCKEPEDPRTLDIRDEGLSHRATNLCWAIGVKTVYDLSQQTSARIRRVRNLGKGTYVELTKCLEKHGLKWKDE